MDTALTKYSTLRIVHIGRTEEGGKTCGPGFPSQVWIGCRDLSREKNRETTQRITRLDVYFPLNFAGGCFFFFFSPTQIVLNVWNSGNYTAGWDDDEGGTAGWTELGPLLDAHSWGGGCTHGRPKVRMPKASEFSHAFPPHHIDPSIPWILCINYGLPINAPPSAFPFFHYIRLPIIVTNQEISPVRSSVRLHLQCFPSASPSSSIPGVRCLTEMVSCFLPAAVSAWHGHIMKSSPLPTSENPIFSISSWRCMTDRVSRWRSKGQLVWTLWRRKK